MASITKLTGFPEWLPAERIVEQYLLDTLRRVFELHGFCSIETRSVEPVDFLLRKGEIDKEVYGVRRLQGGESDKDALALHFDLTVPFARYVLQNAGKLDFPFRRYQIQKSWRGERPQQGRYREFVQADIDIIDRAELAPHFESELVLVIADVFAALDIGVAQMHINNRKLCEGFYRGIGIEHCAPVFGAIDKLDKIGGTKVHEILRTAGLSQQQADQCLALASICTPDDSFAEQVRALGVTHPLLEEGLAQLLAVIRAAHAAAPGFAVADLKIARGLDYYTGTVYETTLVGHEELGSVCSGGRYDELAADGKVSYPGVGLSIGVSRLLSRLLAQGIVRASRSVPTAVLVAVLNEQHREASNAAARLLRGRQIATEVSPNAAKFGNQIKYADRRGIPYVWFVGDDGQHEVKDIRSGEQLAVDVQTWQPPTRDQYPQIVKEETP